MTLTSVMQTSEPAAAGLVVFDLGGTLIRGRSVCELLAVRLGREKRMKEIETLKAALAQACSEMASWYREALEQQLVSFLEAAEFAPRAVEALALLKRHGFVYAISSITWLFAVEWFAERLSHRSLPRTRLSAGGSVVHVWPRDTGR